MTLKFMRETHIYYGPWIDRQRDILYKFFFPYDYKVAEVCTSSSSLTTTKLLRFVQVLLPLRLKSAVA